MHAHAQRRLFHSLSFSPSRPPFLSQSLHQRAHTLIHIYIPLSLCLLMFLSPRHHRTIMYTHTPPAVQLPLLPAGLGQLSSSGLSGPSGVQCPCSTGPLPAAEPPRMNTASSSTICTRQSSAVCPVTQLSEVIESCISHLKGASFCFDDTCAPLLSGWRTVQ